MRRARSLLIATLALLVPLFSCSEQSESPVGTQNPPPPERSTVDAVVERLPGSRNFSPDGTWWGYNMSKVARRGDRVFTYVVENDDNPSTYSTFRIYMKDGEGPWTAGAGFDTTRPGNLLIDSSGALHAFVFEATDIDLNDSVGKLHHYTMPAAGSGDIQTFTHEIVVDHVAGDETVNIRVGAAIGGGDEMVLAFGLGTDADGDTEQVVTKTVGAAAWVQEAAGTQLGHDFYYPFVAVSSAGALCVLPIQDDFTGPGNPNIYQIIRFFERSGGTWASENITDLTGHDLAPIRPRLLEQSDLYIDRSDAVHILYKEYLAADGGTTSSIMHVTGSFGTWSTRSLDPGPLRLNWVRMVEVGTRRYLVATSHDRLYVLNEDMTAHHEIDLPPDMSGIYPYVATRKNGTDDTEQYIDVVLLSGMGGNYPDAANYYVRIAKADLDF